MTLNASTGSLFAVTTQHKHKSRDIKIWNSEYDTWPPSFRIFFMLNSSQIVTAHKN